MLCGLTGCWTGPCSTDPLKRDADYMCHAIRHRRPHDGGVWADSEIGIALGFRRLVYQGQTQEKMMNGSPMPPLVNVAVGLNFNQIRAANQTQALWWGEWEVVDGNQHQNPFGVGL